MNIKKKFYKILFYFIIIYKNIIVIKVNLNVGRQFRQIDKQISQGNQRKVKEKKKVGKRNKKGKKFKEKTIRS